MDRQPRIAHRETLQRGRPAAVAVDDLADLFNYVVATLVGGDAKPQRAVHHPHQGELHAHQRDAADHEAARQQGPRRHVDVRLGRLGDDAAIGVEHPRPQHNQIDAAVVAAPFHRRLIVLQDDSRHGLANGVCDGAPQRPQRHRPHEQPQQRASRKEHNRRGDNTEAEGGTAEVMPFHEIGEGQIQASTYPGKHAC